MAIQCQFSSERNQVKKKKTREKRKFSCLTNFQSVKHLLFFFDDFRTVASAFIAADDDPCNEALEAIFGKKHRFISAMQIRFDLI